MSDQPIGLNLGQNVPEFTMTTYEPAEGGFGEKSLAQLKKDGKWTILFFYPADFTFVCATEFAALADKHDELKSCGAELITVSTDTQFTHLAWQREEKELAGVTYSMGADPTGAVSRLFGVYDEGSGLALRGTFMISPEGKLVNTEVNFYNLGRNVDELVRKLKANIYLSKHGDQACPASWRGEGDKTLTPGAGLVGKVHEALHG